ncbi:alkaline phosphatase, partial [Parabacteroides merdae]|nr:alkaline phosphatase [Parabacteroides merdae]
EVFKDFKCEIVPAKDEKGSPSLGVKNKRKQINITPFSNIVTIGKKGREEIRLNSVIVYVDKNNTFYLPTKLAEYLQ